MKPVKALVALPDPGAARTLDDLVQRLRSLKMLAGDPSYEVITDRVNAVWRSAGRPAAELARRGTVVDCFKTGRRRLNTDLLIAVVQALYPDAGYVAQWTQALRVVLGETQAAAQVRAQDRLPDDLAEFTGRAVELDRLRDLLRRAHDAGGPVVISAIEGMAGVGKTQLAVHAGHLLARERQFEQVLFVNLRGFHPDPAQPPADPATVLDSFLRLLGVAGQQIPHDPAARAAMFRQRLAGKRALVILDNAAHEDQVQPLLPDDPGCLTLVTSRRHLTGLHPATHLAVDVFTPDEALQFLKHAAPDVPIGDDADALMRVARRCGHLPLALGLLAGQMRAMPGWTVTDHADRLDQRHHHRRLDSGIELTLGLSYQHLPPQRQRLLRLLALHPGDDFDSYAAAALADSDLDTASQCLQQLCADHLLQQPTPGRYAFHDLVRTYATDRATDQDRPSDRGAALTRLLDFYLHTAAAAMDRLIPVEQDRRPHIDQQATTPIPPVADLAATRAWLDTERTNLISVAVHAATHGWPQHTTRLAFILHRYLDTAGHFGDAMVLHTHASQTARHVSDREAEAHALTNLGTAYGRLGDHRQGAHYHQLALTLFSEVGDRFGEGRVLANLGNAYVWLGNYRQGAHFHQQALTLFREIGDRLGEARSLGHLGSDHELMGNYPQAAEHHQQALTLFGEIGDSFGQARTLTNLGLVYCRLGDYGKAADHQHRALILLRQLGYRAAEANALTNLGTVYERLGNHPQAADLHRQALALFRDISDRRGEAETLNSLGEALLAAGQPGQARTQYSAALALADQMGERYEQARAHNGLAHVHHATGEPDRAGHHWRHALTLFTDLGVPEADQVLGHLAALDPDDRQR